MLWNPWVIIINLAPHVCRQNNRIQTGLWREDLSYWSRAAGRKMGFQVSCLTALWCSERQSIELFHLTGLPTAWNTASHCDFLTLKSTFSLTLSIQSPVPCPTLRVGFCLLLELCPSFVLYTNMWNPTLFFELGFLKLVSKCNAYFFQNWGSALLFLILISCGAWKVTSEPQSEAWAPVQRLSCLPACMDFPMSPNANSQSLCPCHWLGTTITSSWNTDANYLLCIICGFQLLLPDAEFCVVI